METTERIVEAYVRYVKGWATIPNVRCAGQNEIDLIAIDPISLDRYHIETSISISQGFRKLTAKPFDIEKLRQRVHQAGQRRTVGFFIERKFTPDSVVARLREMGFTPGQYGRVIVTWGWDAAAEGAAKAAGIELWDFRRIIREIADAITGSRNYFADDTLRTLNLFIHANGEALRLEDDGEASRPAAEPVRAAPPNGGGFWVYENWTHRYASVHDASCSFCNGGRGTHAGSSKDNGRWHGPFSSGEEAWSWAHQTGRDEIRRCTVCAPIIATMEGHGDGS